MAPGGRLKQRLLLATSQPEKAGRSRNIGRWLRSSPRREQQPDTFALPICGPVGPRRQNIPVSLGDDDNNTDHNPARLRAWRGFRVLGRSYLSRISGKGPIADSRSVKFSGRDAPIADLPVLAPDRGASTQNGRERAV